MITTDTGAKKWENSDNWRQIYQAHNDSVDAEDAAIAALQDGLAIVANGNTHAAIAAGQFVFVKNHDTLATGLYTASAAIAANATLSGSNLTADASGGLNALNSNLANVSSRIAGEAVAQTTIHAFMKSCKQGISIGNYYYAKSDNPPSTLDWNTIIVVFKVNGVDAISGSDYCLFLYPGKMFLGRPDASEITWYPLN